MSPSRLAFWRCFLCLGWTRLLTVSHCRIGLCDLPFYSLSSAFQCVMDKNHPIRRSPQQNLRKLTSWSEFFHSVRHSRSLESVEDIKAENAVLISANDFVIISESKLSCLQVVKFIVRERILLAVKLIYDILDVTLELSFLNTIFFSSKRNHCPNWNIHTGDKKTPSIFFHVFTKEAHDFGKNWGQGSSCPLGFAVLALMELFFAVSDKCLKMQKESLAQGQNLPNTQVLQKFQTEQSNGDPFNGMKHGVGQSWSGVQSWRGGWQNSRDFTDSVETRSGHHPKGSTQVWPTIRPLSVIHTLYFILFD